MQQIGKVPGPKLRNTTFKTVDLQVPLYVVHALRLLSPWCSSQRISDCSLLSTAVCVLIEYTKYLFLNKIIRATFEIILI